MERTTKKIPSITFAGEDVLLTYHIREGNIPLGEDMGPGISLVFRSEHLSWFFYKEMEK